MTSKADLESLTSSLQWMRLEDLAQATGRFNIFSLLDNALRERSWSRLLAYFLRSGGNHGLANHLLVSWLQRLDLGPEFFLASETTSTTQCEWPTRQWVECDGGGWQSRPDFAPIEKLLHLG